MQCRKGQPDPAEMLTGQVAEQHMYSIDFKNCFEGYALLEWCTALYCVVLRCAMLCCAVLCSDVQCRLLHSIWQYCLWQTSLLWLHAVAVKLKARVEAAAPCFGPAFLSG